MKGCFNPSPPFTHPSPSSFLECKRFSSNGLAINEDLLEASMKTSSSHQWRPTFVISRRLRTYTLHRVKSGEGWWRVEQTLHLSQPQCLSGFQAKRWRVKGEIESRIFTSKTALAANHIPNHRWQLWRILPPDVSFRAWQWHKIALPKGNILP